MYSRGPRCDHALEKLNVLRAICPECSKEVHARVTAVEVYLKKLNRGQGLGFAIQLTGFEPWVVDKRALRAAFAKGYTALLAIMAVYTTVTNFSAGMPASSFAQALRHAHDIKSTRG